MVWINPGRFIMGLQTKLEGFMFCDIPHPVVLSNGYWIGRYEITEAQWRSVMGCESSAKYGYDGYPACCMCCDEAIQFCHRLTEIERKAGRLPQGYAYALPTEAQWEYACLAGSPECYPAPDSIDEVGWFADNAGDGPHPVGKKKPNSWGLYDMIGNMTEWCCDFYAEYPSVLVADPKGPPIGRDHVRRGGSWDAGAVCQNSGFRYRGCGDFGEDCGFRIALSRTDR